MFEFIVLITFTSLAVSTWFSAERTETFLKSFNTTFSYMKVAIFIYSLFSGPSVLEAFVWLELFQIYTNLEQEIKEDNVTLLELLKWVLVNAVTIFALRNPAICHFAGYITRTIYVIEWTKTQELKSIIMTVFLGYIGYHFNTGDLYVLHKLALVCLIYVYLYMTTGMNKITQKKYSYNIPNLPAQVFVSFIDNGQIISNKPLLEFITKTKNFVSFLFEGERKQDITSKDLNTALAAIPDVMTAINALRVSIQTHRKDTEDVVLWINTTKQILIFYVQDLVKEEKDTTKRLMLQSFLDQNDPSRRRSNAIHVVKEEEDEEGEEELKIEEAIELKKKENIEDLEGFLSSEEESSNEGESPDTSTVDVLLSDSQQIL